MIPHFYLGTHEAHWLWDAAADFPMFVSHRRLARYVTCRLSTHGWALDSGGFTELSTYGEWRTTPAWSYEGRRNPPMPGHGHKNCANCLDYARRWRTRLLDGLEVAAARGYQGDLFAGGERVA
jgi:hypothetical protein